MQIFGSVKVKSLFQSENDTTCSNTIDLSKYILLSRALSDKSVYLIEPVIQGVVGANDNNEVCPL